MAIEQTPAAVKTLGERLQEEDDRIIQKLFQSEKLASFKEVRIFLQDYAKFIEGDYLHKEVGNVKKAFDEDMYYLENMFAHEKIGFPKSKEERLIVQAYLDLQKPIDERFEKDTLELNSRIEMKTMIETELKAQIENIQELLTSEEETLSDEERLSSINAMIVQIEKVLDPMKSIKNPFSNTPRSEEDIENAIKDGTIVPQNFSPKNNS